MTTTIQGLTGQEVQARRARGQGNDAAIQTSRSYGQILRQNVFTFINVVLFSIGFFLLALGRVGDAFLSVGIVALNVVVGVAQEARAKRQLDQIALLTRPKATVIRDGQRHEIDPSEIVLGDVLAVGPGDQIVVDGVVAGEGRMDVDESLLTGESDLIPKRAGDAVYSGSFAVTGSALYEATRVGLDSLANQITAGARKFHIERTPLQREVAFIVRLLVALAVFIGILLLIAAVYRQLSLVESVQRAAVVAGLIPATLFLMITLTYAMGALRMAGRGALIQQANAVESISNVDVLCLDKTGTLTANRIHFHALNVIEEGHPFSVEDVQRLLGAYAASTTAGNRTSAAIAEAFPGEACAVAGEVPFSSARKWSALTFHANDAAPAPGTFVLGAPEILAEHLMRGSDIGPELHSWVEQGLRVLLFTYHPALLPIFDDDSTPDLSRELVPLAVLSFSDELRAEAKATIAGFKAAGIRLKIISGDNPNTVAALAKQAGLDDDIQVIAGPQLAEMDERQFDHAAETTTIFGRITPEQKQRLVRSLRAGGHYVAMIGDGVNDVLSLKQAQIGIAMQSGSQATRGVADIVLLNDSFAALPYAFQEGQRIINGMQDVLRLFLSRVLYVALLILAITSAGAGFPFVPTQNSLLILLTAGIPTFFMAAWARPGQESGQRLTRILHFVVPAALLLGFTALGVYLGYYSAAYDDVYRANAPAILLQPDDDPALIPLSEQELIQRQGAQIRADRAAQVAASSALLTVTVLMGLALIVFVEPPLPFLAGGDEYSGDWRPSILVLALLGVYIFIVNVPALRDLFELQPFPQEHYLFMTGLVIVWAAVLRAVWRARLFTRIFQMGGDTVDFLD